MQHTSTYERNWHRWLLSYFIAFLFTTSTFAQISNFISGQVATGSGCDWPYSSLATNPVNGNVYGFWRMGASENAIYSLVRFNGTTWTTVSSFGVNSVPNFDRATDDVSLVIDANGSFHVAFRGDRGPTTPCCNTTRGVWYGYSANGTTWTFTEIDTYSDPNGWKNTDDPIIQVDSQNRPHIAFRFSDVNGNRTHSIRYFYSNGTIWNGATAFSQTGVSNEITELDFALDRNGKAHLAFQLETNGSGLDGGLWYVTNTSGSWSSAQELAHGDNTAKTYGYAISVDTDAANKVHIVHSDNNRNLLYLNNVSGSFSGGQINGSLTGYSLIHSLVINSGGDRFLAYSDGGLKYAYLLSGVTGNWTTGTAYAAPQGTEVGITPNALLTNDRRIMYLFDSKAPGNCGAANTRNLWYATATMQGAPTQVAPTVTTNSAGSITTTSSVLGGNVTADGGATVTERGIVYSTNTNPTIGGNGVTQAPNGSGIGTFSATIQGLMAGTTYNVRAYARNSAGTSYGSNQTFTTSAPTITLAPATLPDGTGGVAYSQTVTSSGGTAPYSYARTAGALPPSMTLSSAGVLSGTPTAVGTFNFTITSTDAGNFTGSRNYSIMIVAPTITVTPATLLNGTVGAAYNQTLSASGGTSTYSYAITAGVLPAGMMLSSAGVLSGTPTAGGTFTFTITSTDARGFTGSRNYTLTTAAPTITLAPATLPNGTVGLAYTQTISASGGTAPYTLALTAGALPSGMTLASNGVLSGTPTAGGTFNFTVRATDASTGSGPYSGTQNYSLIIGAPTITLAPATLPNGTVGSAYNQTITASGGIGSYSYAVTAGALPPGMALTPAGVISGTPTGGGTYAFTLTATDMSTGTGAYSGSRNYSLTIGAPTITLAPATLPSGIIGAAYTQTITPSGGTSPYTYAVADGTLPPGLTLSAVGVLSGTPTSGGTFTFTLRATDSSTGTGPYSGSRIYSLTIVPPTINGLTVAPAAVCTGSSVTVTGTIGQNAGTYSYTLIYGSQIIIGSTTNIVSQTLTTNGSGQQTIVLRAGTDASYNQGSTTLTVNPLPVVSIVGLASAYCKDAIAVTLAGAPAGGSFTIDGTAATQFVSGTLATGSHTVGYVYTDGKGCTNAASQSVTINNLPVVSITNLASAFCQDASPVTLTGTPAGAGGSFTIDGASTSTLTPLSLTVGQHTVGYRFTDANGCSNSTSQNVTIKLTPGAPSLLTQTGQSYPGSQSAVTVDLNTGNVTLLASNCAGSVNWTGPNNTAGTTTSIIVPTAQAGLFTYQATCTIDGCTGPLATATVRVGGRLTLLHRDVDNYADNNAIQPLLQIQNQGAGALPLSKLTLRYYLTVENGSTLGNLSMNYAQLGNQNVRLRYVPLIPAQQGATGYVEYSFTDGAGSLAAGANSGSIQGYFTKSDYGSLYEPDDYSYNPVRDQLTGNLRITAYYDGVLIAGLEPGSTAQIRAVRALTESKNGPSATQIGTYLEVRNEGNVAINYSDLKVRYYFTAEGTVPLNFELDYTSLGGSAIQPQFVRLATPLANADTYLELQFTNGGQLAPGASTGLIRYRVLKSDYSYFNQSNDYSYQERPENLSQNSRVVVYAGNERIWGQEPGAAGRVAFAELGRELSVTVLGNPVVGEQVSFEVSGAGSEPLHFRLLTPQGKVVSQQQVSGSPTTERHQLSLGGQADSMFLLQVSTPTQSRTVKVLKAN